MTFRVPKIVIPVAIGLALAWAGPSAAADPSAGGAKHCLWRVTGPEGHEVFLLGSFHALPADAYPLAPVIEDAYRAAHSVYFEVDLAETEALGGRMMAAGALPPETRLGDVLDPETRAQFDAYLERAKLSFGTFEAMKPWMAALSVTALELMKRGYSADSGLDVYLTGKAHKDGKKVGAFETADYQIGLFSGMTDEESRSFLRYALKDAENVAEELDEVTTAWKTGDVASLEALLTESFGDEPQLYEELVTVRNRAWLPKVEALLAQGEPALVVVGALHLVGPGGLVAMLQRRGYRVEQL